MAGRYVALYTLKDRDDLHRFASFALGTVAIGTYHGCSCCEGNEPLTLDLIDEHIKCLRKDLTRALQVKRMVMQVNHV
jgi:hypothetical protein